MCWKFPPVIPSFFSHKLRGQCTKHLAIAPRQKFVFPFPSRHSHSPLSLYVWGWCLGAWFTTLPWSLWAQVLYSQQKFVFGLSFFTCTCVNRIVILDYHQVNQDLLIQIVGDSLEISPCIYGCRLVIVYTTCIYQSTAPQSSIWSLIVGSKTLIETVTYCSNLVSVHEYILLSCVVCNLCYRDIEGAMTCAICVHVHVHALL